MWARVQTRGSSRTPVDTLVGFGSPSRWSSFAVRHTPYWRSPLIKSPGPGDLRFTDTGRWALRTLSVL